MFYCVQVKVVIVGLFYDLMSLIFNFFCNCVIVKIDIFFYQIVKIIYFIINLIVLVIVGIVIDDFKNVVFVGIFDVINVVEIVIVLNKVGILVCVGREGVVCLVFVFNDVVIDLCVVILIYVLNVNMFFFVCVYFVVYDDVEQYCNIIFFECVYCCQ